MEWKGSGISVISSENIRSTSCDEEKSCKKLLSQYKGVVPQPNGHWGAQIYEKHQRVWLGTFNQENDAARAYDEELDQNNNASWNKSSSDITMASKLGIPRVNVELCAPYYTNLFHALWSKLPRNLERTNSGRYIISRDAKLTLLSRSQIPSNFPDGDESDWTFKIWGELYDLNKQSWTTVINTFYEFEGDDVDEFQKRYAGAVWPIRPLLPESFLSGKYLTTTGHCLGAALATLCAFDIVLNDINKPNGRATPIPMTTILFDSPRVGNDAFKKVFDKLLDLSLLCVTNNHDLIPLYPLGYTHLGVELRVDTDKSPYLKNPGNASLWHNLESYLHAVAGTRGKNDTFTLEID